MNFSHCIQRLIVFLILIAPKVAFAESHWEYIGQTKPGSIYVADVNSIRERQPVQILRPFLVRTIWVKGDHSSDSTVKYRSSTSLYAFDCSARTMAQLSSVKYSADGSVFSSWSDTTDSHYDYEPVAPDTIGEAFLEKACNNSGE